MRDKVNAILLNEAERLLELSKREGLVKEDLAFLSQLIRVYQDFVGDSADEENLPPEQLTTEKLLKSLSNADKDAGEKAE